MNRTSNNTKINIKIYIKDTSSIAFQGLLFKDGFSGVLPDLEKAGVFDKVKGDAIMMLECAIKQGNRV